IKGQVALKDFQCNLEGVPFPLSKIKGSIGFGDAGIEITDLTGLLGKSPVKVGGTLSRESMEVDIVTDISNGDLKSLNLLPAMVRLSKSIPLSVRLEGKPDELRYSASLDLKKNAFRIDHWVRKRPGTPLAVEVAGTRGSAGWSIEQAYLTMGRIRVPATGKVGRTGELQLRINLPPKGIRTEHLIPFAEPSLELKPGGRIEGDVGIKAGPDWKKSPYVDASLKLYYVTGQIFGFYKLTSGLTGNVNLKGKKLVVYLKSVKIGNTSLSGKFSFSGYHSPRVKMDVEYSFLDFNDFTAPPGYHSNFTWGEWIRNNFALRFLARSHGSASIRVLKGRTWKRAFSDFRTVVKAGNGFLKMDDWQAKMAEGVIRGSAVLDIRAGTKTPMKLEFEAERLRMERLLAADMEEVSIKGDVRLDGQLKWNTTQRKENEGICKTGSMNVRVRDGVIHRFDILSKIFTLVNFGSLLRGRLPDFNTQGLPFHRLTWDMDVFLEKWKVTDLKLQSDAVRADGSGIYFRDQGRIDFRVDVSPLVGLDKLVSGIFGDLLTKNGKILTTTFLIRGLFASPDVRLVPLESFTPTQR
ncbi:AsmA-like C-terminal domain-containing protein, partial [Thermodesulfobacteriota bacterium]